MMNQIHIEDLIYISTAVNCNDHDAVVKVCVCVVSVIQAIIRCAMCIERGVMLTSSCNRIILYVYNV